MMTPQATMLDALNGAHERTRELRVALMDAEIAGVPLTLTELFEHLDGISINIVIGRGLANHLVGAKP